MPEPSLDPPEPDLTPKQLIERAVALRPQLIERQAEVEERTYYSEEMHLQFLDAGFYRMYVPRRYGGYEFDMPTFMRVTLELARGCPSTAWCLSLASAHALQIGSWFPEEAQEEIFGDGDFRCASVAAPIGPATRTDDGWELNGKVGYASGVPYSTHYMGQAMMPGFDPAGPPPEMLLFVAPRDQWTMLDDWGWSMGLKGSGSHSIRFDGTRIPASWGLENTFMVDVDVSNGTPGLTLHGNPLYAGRALGGFTMTLAAAWIGAAYNALDDFENNVRTKMTPLPPFIPRMYDPDYQRFFGGAMGKLAMVEAALFNCADQHMELCRRSAEEGVPFTYGDDQRLGCIAREAYIHASQTMEEFIFGPAGSSATRAGERMERMFRDIAMAAGHRNTLLRDWAFRELACEQLGVPRDPASGNRQMVPQS
jgi:3-hydroxy-9,10-secoandrosta-1,3,5(10)-triene-9,17-dione monooxygenase